jgi:hypothetical protein
MNGLDKFTDEELVDELISYLLEGCLLISLDIARELKKRKDKNKS